MKRVLASIGSIVFFLGLNYALGSTQESEPYGGRPLLNIQREEKVLTLSLQECIEIALERNFRSPASKFAVEIAKAQYKQAQSTFWPQLEIKSSFMHMDEDPDFVFPAHSFVLDMPFLPMPLPINIPALDIKLMDKTNIMNSINLTYPLFIGGLRPALIKQAKSGLEAAKQTSRRTALEVIYDVKRYYYGCVLAKAVNKIGKDTLARLRVTLELTENLYKGGSARVRKTDYLRTKTIVEATSSLTALLESNYQLAKAAVLNAMGLDWDTQFEPSEDEIPFNSYQANLKELINNTYIFSPDWARLEAGLQAAEAKIGEAKSGYFPKIGLIGSLNYISNTYNKGFVTPTNKKSWMVGVGLEIPIFNGFLTRNKVREARARFAKLKQEQIMIREGLALHVKHIFLQMIRAQEQQKASEAAVESAEQYRELNVRAYQDELVETKDVIESQIIEAFMRAQYQKILYDHIEAQAHLDFVIGEKVHNFLRRGTE